MASTQGDIVFRVTGLPASQSDDRLCQDLSDYVLSYPDHLSSTTIVPSCYNDDEKVALVAFSDGLPEPLCTLADNSPQDYSTKMRGTDIHFDRHFFGFTQLYSPKPESQITADIVAITGLDGHAYGSWRGKAGSRRMWLRDFLSKDLPQCRTMIYGYNSKLSAHGVDTILDYSRGLIEELKKIRSTEELRERPLFFIAHSFGGIILAHCLVRAARAKDDDYPTEAALYKATYGVLLFGIPHKGLIVDDVQKMIGGQNSHPCNALLDQIKSESDPLAVQLSEFKTIIRDRKVVSFYETQQTPQLELNLQSGKWSRTGDFVTVVDANSALLQLPDSEEDKIPLDADHSTMVKFDSNNKLGYTSAREKLRRFERQAPNEVAARFGKIKKDFSVTFSLDVNQAMHFTGRCAEVKEIHEILHCNFSPRTAVIQGIGGIGKTQVAIAYANEYRKNYSGIFWLNARDEDSLKQSFARVGRQISYQHALASGFNHVDGPKTLEEVVNEVKNWLSLPNNTRWLMIYDDYDTPVVSGKRDPRAVDIRDFLPNPCQGCIIITTRDSHVQPVRAILGHYYVTSTDLLAEILGGHPQAMATAGAYLRQPSTSFARYLYLYEQARLKLKSITPKSVLYKDQMRILCSTLQVSLGNVEKRNPLSAKLLRLWAYFDSEDIWLQLLQHPVADSFDWIRELTADERCFDQAMRVLSDHGLVQPAPCEQGQVGSGGYSMHKCVHFWSVHVLNQVWDWELARQALQLISAHVPTSDQASWWTTQRRLLHHAANYLGGMSNSQLTGRDMEHVWHKLGQLFADQGKLADAETMYQRALQGYAQALEPYCAYEFDAVHKSAGLSHDQGQLEKMYRGALQGYERARGRDHASTLIIVNNLGLLYADQGKLADAEIMFQRALQGYETTLGLDDTYTLETVNNLGLLYAKQCRLLEAEMMHQRVLKGYEKTLGPYHAHTLETISKLGLLYADQNRLADAEIMHNRALRGYERAFGRNHTYTLDTCNNLGLLHVDQGKLNDAKIMYQRALEGFTTLFTPSYCAWPLVALRVLVNLGDLLDKQGHLVTAKETYRNAQLGLQSACSKSSSRYQAVAKKIESIDARLDARLEKKPARSPQCCYF